MNVAELKQYLEDQPDEAVVAIYADAPYDLGNVEFMCLLDEGQIELEDAPSNAAGLPTPALIISLSAGDNVL